MADDNEVQIGVTADDQATDALSALAELLETQTEAMMAGFEKLAQASEESTNRIVESLEDVKKKVEESGDEIGERLDNIGDKFVELAEHSHLSVTGVASAFGLLSGAMGIFGIAGAGVVGFLGEELEKTKEQAESLDRLSQATGISAAQLEEFNLVLKQHGVESENSSFMFLRLGRAIDEAAKKSPEYVAAFRQIGVETDNWHNKMPTLMEGLQMVSEGMHNTSDNAKVMDSGQRILGRSSLDLIGVFKEEGKDLKDNMASQYNTAQSMQDAAEAAKALTRAESEMSEGWKGLLATVLPKLVEEFAYVKSTLFDVSGEAAKVGLYMELGFNESSIAVQEFWAKLKGDTTTFNKLKDEATVFAMATKMELSNVDEQIKKNDDDLNAFLLKMEGVELVKPGKPPAVPTLAEPADNSGREAELAGEEHHQEQLFEARREGIERYFKLGLESADQRLAMEQATNAAELKETADLINQKEALLDKSAKDYAKQLQEMENAKVAAADKAKKEDQKDVQEWQTFNEKAAADVAKAAEKWQVQMEEDNKKRLEKEMADDLKRVNEEKELNDKAEANERAHQDRMREVTTAQLEYEVTAGVMSENKKNDLIDAADEKHYADERKLITDQLATMEGNDAKIVADRQALYAKLSKLDDDYWRKKFEDAKTEADEERAILNPITTAFTSNVTKMLEGQEKLKTGMRQIAATILNDWIQMLVKHYAMTVENGLMELVFHQTTKAKELAAEYQAAMAKQAAQKTSAVASIMTSAGELYAGADAYYSATGDPELAPALAAADTGAMLGMAMSFIAERGFDVPGGNSPLIGMLHPREMVLPAGEADVVRSMENKGGGGSMHSSTTTSTNAIHYHAYGKRSQADIASDAKATFKAMAGMARLGRLRM